MTETLKAGMARDYSGYLRLRERLAEAVAELADRLDEADMGMRAARLRTAREALLGDAFRLMVLGEFKRGKSTLINALLGADVLPARVAPCTAVISEVRWGETPTATLYPKDPAGEPLSVPVDQLRAHIVIREEDEDDGEGDGAPSPWARLEVTHPLPLLSNNVVLVDSPGLNEHETRTRLAVDYLAGADAVVLVLSCQQALSATELAFLDGELAGRNLRHVFFVWNHADAIAGDADAHAALDARIAQELTTRVGDAEHVFKVSAREALVARKGGDAPEAGGLGALERSLERFLATERGKVKLLTPLRQAEAAVREALGAGLAAREKALGEPVAELAARYAAEQPRLEAVARRRQEVLATIAHREGVLTAEAVAAYQAFVATATGELPQALAGVEVGAIEAIISRRRSHERLAEHMDAWFSARAAQWRDDTLAPLVDRHAAQLRVELDEAAGAFLAELDAARAAIAPGLSALPGGQSPDIAPVDRLFSAIGGFLVGGVGAAIEGASVGFAGMSRGLVLHVGLGVALAAMGLGLPVALPVLAAVGVGRTLWEAQAGVAELRERLATDMGAQLTARLPGATQELTGRIAARFDVLSRQADVAMAEAQEEAIGQARAILEAKLAGEAALAAAKGSLARLREQLVASERALATVRFELEGA